VLLMTVSGRLPPRDWLASLFAEDQVSPRDRSTLLAGGAAALLAGPAPITVADSAPHYLAPNCADAELIRLCQRLEAVEREWTAICEADEWAPDREPGQSLLAAV
jgi:hypothetical protein